MERHGYAARRRRVRVLPLVAKPDLQRRRDDDSPPPFPQCFAGHCDWRLPTIAELQTILLAPYPCGTSPCIDPIFGPTQSDCYWSATSESANSDAWYVYFATCYVTFHTKFGTCYVRAVRGGS